MVLLLSGPRGALFAGTGMAPESALTAT